MQLYAAKCKWNWPVIIDYRCQLEHYRCTIVHMYDSPGLVCCQIDNS